MLTIQTNIATYDLLALVIVFIDYFVGMKKVIGKAKRQLSAVKVICLKGSAKILDALCKKDEMIYSELADVVGFATTTTRGLRALEDGNFITRQVLNKPYRPVAYSLTDRGKRLCVLLSELEKL